MFDMDAYTTHMIRNINENMITYPINTNKIFVKIKLHPSVNNFNKNDVICFVNNIPYNITFLTTKGSDTILYSVDLNSNNDDDVDETGTIKVMIKHPEKYGILNNAVSNNSVSNNVVSEEQYYSFEKIEATIDLYVDELNVTEEYVNNSNDYIYLKFESNGHIKRKTYSGFNVNIGNETLSLDLFDIHRSEDYDTYIERLSLDKLKDRLAGNSGIITFWSESIIGNNGIPVKFDDVTIKYDFTCPTINISLSTDIYSTDILVQNNSKKSLYGIHNPLALLPKFVRIESDQILTTQNLNHLSIKYNNKDVMYESKTRDLGLYTFEILNLESIMGNSEGYLTINIDCCRLLQNSNGNTVKYINPLEVYCSNIIPTFDGIEFYNDKKFIEVIDMDKIYTNTKLYAELKFNTSVQLTREHFKIGDDIVSIKSLNDTTNILSKFQFEILLKENTIGDVNLEFDKDYNISSVRSCRSVHLSPYEHLLSMLKYNTIPFIINLEIETGKKHFVYYDDVHNQYRTSSSEVVIMLQANRSFKHNMTNFINIIDSKLNEYEPNHTFISKEKTFLKFRYNFKRGNKYYLKTKYSPIDVFGNTCSLKDTVIFIDKRRPMIMDINLIDNNNIKQPIVNETRFNLMDQIEKFTIIVNWLTNTVNTYDLSKFKIIHKNIINKLDTEKTQIATIDMSKLNKSKYSFCIEINPEDLIHGEYDIIFENGFVKDINGSASKLHVFTFNSLYSGGNGTEKTPYLIGNYNDLNFLSNIYDSKHLNSHFKMISSIVSNSIPIGTKTYPFTGHFDGNNYMIKDVYFDINCDNVGIFGFVKNATIKNIVISGSINIKGCINVGIFVGIAINTTIDNITINEEVINNSLISGDETIGIFAGTLNNCFVNNVYINLYATITGNNILSTFCALIYESNITNVFIDINVNLLSTETPKSNTYYGSFSAITSKSVISNISQRIYVVSKIQFEYFGGMFGKLENRSTLNNIKSCLIGNITSDKIGSIAASVKKSSISNIDIFVNGNINGRIFNGGVFGEVESSMISDLYLQMIGEINSVYDETESNMNDVYGTGGLVGYAYKSTFDDIGIILIGNLKAQWADNDVSNFANLGGIGGRILNSIFKSCYNAINGSIIGIGINVGGLIGFMSSETSIVSSYNAMNGTIKGSDVVGGLVGSISNSSAYCNFNMMSGNIDGDGSYIFTKFGKHSCNYNDYNMMNNLIVSDRGISINGSPIDETFTILHYLNKKTINIRGEIITFTKKHKSLENISLYDETNNKFYYHPTYDLVYLPIRFNSYASLYKNGINHLFIMTLNFAQHKNYIQCNILDQINFKVIKQSNANNIEHLMVRDICVVTDKNNDVKELVSLDSSNIQLTADRASIIGPAHETILHGINYFDNIKYEIIINNNDGYKFENEIVSYKDTLKVIFSTDRYVKLNITKLTNCNVKKIKLIGETNIVSTQWEVTFEMLEDIASFKIMPGFFVDLIGSLYSVDNKLIIIEKTNKYINQINIIHQNGEKIDITNNQYNIQHYRSIDFNINVSTNYNINQIDTSMILLNNNSIKTSQCKKQGIGVVINIPLHCFIKGKNLISFNNGAFDNNTTRHIIIINAFSNGLGTLKTPYSINNVDDLLYLSEDSDFWESHFEQTSDIDMKYVNFYGIGSKNKHFTGSYNGKNHQIKSLNIASGDDDSLPCGLFNVLNGHISYLNIQNVNLFGNNYIGTIAGFMDYNGVISRCNVYGKLSLCSSIKTLGGLVGKSLGMVYKCSIYGEGYLMGTGKIGGLIGHNEGKCIYSFQSIKGEIIGTNYVGGLIGYQAPEGITHTCYMSMLGNITKNITRRENFDISGLIGYQEGYLKDSFVASNAVIDGNPISSIHQHGIEENNYFLNNLGMKYKHYDEKREKSVSSLPYNIMKKTFWNMGTLYNIKGIDCIYRGLKHKKIHAIIQPKSNVYLPKIITNNDRFDEFEVVIVEHNNKFIIESNTTKIKSEDNDDEIMILDTKNNTVQFIYNKHDYLDLIKNQNLLHSNMTIELMTDLDLNGVKIKPLGTPLCPFSSVFNGNNHTIYNINIEGKDYAGLFGSINHAIIKNLNLSGDIIIKSDKKIGALCSYCVNSKIRNCSYKGDGNIKLTGKKYIGLLFGIIYNSKISGCKIITDSKIIVNDIDEHFGIFAGQIGTHSKLDQIDIVANGGIEINGSNINGIGGFCSILNNKCIFYDISLTINNGITIKSNTKESNTNVKNIGGLFGTVSYNVEISTAVFNFNGNIETHISDGTNEANVEYVGACIGAVNEKIYATDILMNFQGNVVGNTKISDTYTDTSERNDSLIFINSEGSNIRVIELN